MTAYRWGDHENHSYIVGIFEHESTARAVATSEEYERGNKYECEVIEHKLNDNDLGHGHINREIGYKKSDIESLDRYIEKLRSIKESMEKIYENQMP